MGLTAILVSIGFLAFLLVTIVSGGLPAFTYNYLKLNVDLSQVEQNDVKSGDYDSLLKEGVYEAMPYLEGRKGDDTYHFGLGYDSDQIYDYAYSGEPLSMISPSSASFTLIWQTLSNRFAKEAVNFSGMC